MKMSVFGAVHNQTTSTSQSDTTANIWVASSDGDITRVQALITSGEASANEQDEHGYSPLHAASSYGHCELLRFLLNNGANPNIQDEDGDTPLHACECPTCASLLVEAGASLSKQNHERLIPIQVIYKDASGDSETVQQLRRLHRQADIRVPELELESEEDDDE
eukprot:gb/GECG01003876.1/.p1 GENE.gb/GECG01003876.1/~~gb/GECG01003876.1/.p1  ORF type:complete len:164 (+),score=24.24 gb/GECG01003876.1/:1-492(+)